jgi:hypothetical protein
VVSEAKDRTLARAQCGSLPPGEARVARAGRRGRGGDRLPPRRRYRRRAGGPGRRARPGRHPQPAPRRVRGVPWRPLAGLRSRPHARAAPCPPRLNTRPTRRAPGANGALRHGLSMRACSVVPGPRADVAPNCRACRGAPRGAGPGSQRERGRRRSAPRRWARSQASRLRSCWSPPSDPRPSPAGATRVPGWMVGPLAHRLPGLAEPADAAGRPHARARDPRRAWLVAPSRRARAWRRSWGGGGRRRTAVSCSTAALADRRLQLPALRAHAATYGVNPLQRCR